MMFASSVKLSTRSLLYSAAFVAFATSVQAHEHHNDAIPEGEGVSVEPLVSPDSFSLCVLYPA